LKCSLDRIDRRKFLRHAAWGGAAATICGVSARNLIASAPQTKQVPIAPATVLTTNTAEAVRTGRATFSPTWESLRSRHTPVPDWMRDAKYGIYCHCGVYSVPDYDSEHYEHRMYDDSPYTKYGTHQRQIAIYGPLEKFGYHSFILRTRRIHQDAHHRLRGLRRTRCVAAAASGANHGGGPHFEWQRPLARDPSADREPQSSAPIRGDFAALPLRMPLNGRST
jgi:hypothetical protein